MTPSSESRRPGDPSALDATVAAGRRAAFVEDEIASLTRELRQRDRELALARARADALVAVVADVSSGAPGATALGAALSHAAEVLGAYHGALFLLAPDGRHLRAVLDTSPEGITSAKTDLLPGASKALETGVPSLVTRSSAEGDERGILEAAGASARLVVPLSAHGRRLGLLCLDLADEGVRPSDEDVAFAKAIGEHCALALSRSQALDAEHEARLRAEAAEAEARGMAHTQEQLAAVVGHDLRTPISAIRMAASLLLQRGLEQHHATMVERIARSASRMTDIIRDLLDFSRARQGLGILVRSEQTDVGDLCLKVAQEHVGDPADAHVNVRIRGDTQAAVDPSRISQVIANLVGNARQHGAGTDVDVAVTGEAGEVVIAVHNGGRAIPPELLPHLFEAFRQGPPSPQGGARPAGSVGLGLFIVREIVRSHGGTIQVSSDDSTGTRFEVRLPRAPRAPQAQPVASDPLPSRIAAEERRGLAADATFRALVENAPDVIARLDREQRYMYVNRAVERVTGIPPEAFIGKTNAEVGLPEAACARWGVALARVFETGSDVEIEFEFACAGADRSYHARGIPERAPDGSVPSAVAIVRDVTDARRASAEEAARRAAEAALRERIRSEAAVERVQQLLQSIVDNSGAVVYVKRSDGTYLLVNRAFEALTGVARDHVLGMTDHDIFPPDQADVFRANDRAVLERGVPLVFEEVVTHSGGTRQYLEVKFPVDDEARGARAVGAIATDITDRKRAEQEARLAVQARDEILSVLTHDLRSPVESIGAIAARLLAGTSDGDTADALATLDRLARHTAQLISDVDERARGCTALPRAAAAPPGSTP